MVNVGNILEIQKKHIEKFDVEPYVIGLFWNDIDELEKQIEKSLTGDKPYNEYEMLSTIDQIEYDNGNLQL